MAWDTLLQGVGSLASAWGEYEMGKEANKIAKERLKYEKSKDAIASRKRAQAQSELGSALANVYGTDRKKSKKKKGSLADAYEAPGELTV